VRRRAEVFHTLESGRLTRRAFARPASDGSPPRRSAAMSVSARPSRAPLSRVGIRLATPSAPCSPTWPKIEGGGRLIDPPTPHATPDEIAQALSFALLYDGRRGVQHADDLMARITAERLVKHLEASGFVLMKRPPGGVAPSVGARPWGEAILSDGRRSDARGPGCELLQRADARFGASLRMSARPDRKLAITPTSVTSTGRDDRRRRCVLKQLLLAALAVLTLGMGIGVADTQGTPPGATQQTATLQPAPSTDSPGSDWCNG
jgi:hypothetical protein